jgi:hypothetical protein
MICETCLAALESKRAHPYSRVMDKFCLRACGYHISAKMARMSTSTSRPWFRHG